MHPSNENDRHELFLVCDSLDATIQILADEAWSAKR